MKRFKNILYILDETTISQGNSAEKVANIARLNKAKVTTLIAEEKARLDDLRLHISGRYNEIQRAILQLLLCCLQSGCHTSEQSQVLHQLRFL